MDSSDGTSGPLAWLVAIPTVILVVGLPALVISALLLTVFVTLDTVVGVPTLRLGLLELVGIPAEFGLPILACVVPGVLISLALLAHTGFDWEGTDGDGRIPGSDWFP